MDPLALHLEAFSRKACPVDGGLVQILRIDADAGDEVVAPNYNGGGWSCRGSPRLARSQKGN